MAKGYRAVMNIMITDKGRVDFRSDAKPQDLVALLGATEMAAKRLKEDISRQYNEYEKAPHRKNDLLGEFKRVTRDEAMKIYMKLGSKLQTRILDIHKSDEMAKFEVPVDLIDSL